MEPAAVLVRAFEVQVGREFEIAAVRTRAVPSSDKTDGPYKLYGQKIFITYGEQDYTDNIIHLVLARTPTAPEGVKGISLFLVPKFMVNDDGSLGARNDVHFGGRFWYHVASSGGADLSVGQWQKIAIARLFFRDAPFVSSTSRQQRSTRAPSTTSSRASRSSSRGAPSC